MEVWTGKRKKKKHEIRINSLGVSVAIFLSATQLTDIIRSLLKLWSPSFVYFHYDQWNRPQSHWGLSGEYPPYQLFFFCFFPSFLTLSSVCGPIRDVPRHCSMCSETPTRSSLGQKGRLPSQIAAQAGFGYLRCWIMHHPGSSASWACPLYPYPLLCSASRWASYPACYTPVALLFLCWITAVCV